MENNLTKESVKEGKSLSKVIKIDEAQIQSHLDMMVRDIVEQILNELLEAEAEDYTYRVFLFAGLRILPKHYGVHGSVQVPSVN